MGGQQQAVACRLPGSAVFERSASKAASAAANGPAGSFKVALGHCGIHWVCFVTPDYAEQLIQILLHEL